MLDHPDQGEFDHFQNGQKSDDDFKSIRIIGKQLHKGNRLFDFKDVDDLGDFVFDRDFIRRHFNPVIVGYSFKNFLKGVDQFK